MKNPIYRHTLVALMLAASVPALRAQLVADGATAAINSTSTNIAGNLTIGTNGAFTTLIITNAGAVTNTGAAAIGLNLFAMTNRVLVTHANSIWRNQGDLAVGAHGSFNELTVNNGGKVFGNSANIGSNLNSAYNLVIVTGNGSQWTLTDTLNVGSDGPSNRLMVANGGKVVNQSGAVGRNTSLFYGAGTIGNAAVISDPGSQWINNAGLSVGPDSSFNQMLITNGGSVLSAGAYVGGKSSQSGSGHSNIVVITGTGSAWTNTSTSSIGNFGTGNRLTITNGGAMRGAATFSHLVLGWQLSGSNNTLLVTGTNSLFSNRGSSSALSVGQGGSFNQLFVRDGGAVETDVGELGANSSGSYNVAVVADPGSRWFSTLNLYVGNAGSFNQLTVGSGGLVAANGFYLGFFDTSSNNTAAVTGGSIIVTNATGTSIADVRGGALTLDSGLIRANIVLLTNGAQSQFIFNGGTLQTGALTNSNGSPFIVGNGLASATLQLLGSNGTHVFAGGLQISTNALLTGNGTIIGNVTNASGSTLSPGDFIGKFVINGNLKLADGSASIFELNKIAGTNDSIAGLTSVTYGGRLHLIGLGPLVGGDAFKLFTATSYSGAFSELVPSTPGPNLEWDTSSLVANGTVRVASAPYVTSQPADKTVSVGQNATFTVTAAGSVSLSYQWRFNGTNIGGANASNYTRLNAQTSDAGPYDVVITNSIGSVTSSVATLTVNLPNAVATNLVISQIYGGGGNVGATYKSDFVELFNPTANTINVDTWSLQYANANGTTWLVGNLRGSVAPYHYYLVQMFTGVNGGAIPTADATNTINMNVPSGKVALVTDQLPLTGNPAMFNSIADFVGFGNANAFEGSAPAPGAPGGNNVTAILRKNGGYTDANDNTNDFITLSPPAPRNSASPANPPSVPAIAATLSSPAYAANHQFRFTVTGTAGTNYIVQASTNLGMSNWLSLVTNASPFTFVETNANSFTQRFYRAYSR